MPIAVIFVKNAETCPQRGFDPGTSRASFKPATTRTLRPDTDLRVVTAKKESTRMFVLLEVWPSVIRPWITLLALSFNCFHRNMKGFMCNAVSAGFVVDAPISTVNFLISVSLLFSTFSESVSVSQRIECTDRYIVVENLNEYLELHKLFSFSFCRTPLLHLEKKIILLLT